MIILPPVDSCVWKPDSFRSCLFPTFGFLNGDQQSFFCMSLSVRAALYLCAQRYEDTLSVCSLWSCFPLLFQFRSYILPNSCTFDLLVQRHPGMTFEDSSLFQLPATPTWYLDLLYTQKANNIWRKYHCTYYHPGFHLQETCNVCTYLMGYDFFTMWCSAGPHKSNFLYNSNLVWNDPDGRCITPYRLLVGAKWRLTSAQLGKLWCTIHRNHQDSAVFPPQQNHYPSRITSHGC